MSTILSEVEGVCVMLKADIFHIRAAGHMSEVESQALLHRVFLLREALATDVIKQNVPLLMNKEEATLVARARVLADSRTLEDKRVYTWVGAIVEAAKEQGYEGLSYQAETLSMVQHILGSDSSRNGILGAIDQLQAKLTQTCMKNRDLEHAEGAARAIIDTARTEIAGKGIEIARLREELRVNREETTKMARSLTDIIKGKETQIADLQKKAATT